MGRALRMDPDDGWHHVMNRGVARQPVFLTARDGRTFLSILGDACDKFGVEIHAYCLMGNHFHLLAHCPEGGLSGLMQRIGSRYTRYLNDRLSRDGPIFRGRFRSILIDSEQYLARAGRYIHRNPADVRPPVALNDYRWSSFRHYCGVVSPPWLQTATLTEMQGGAAAYREFVERSGCPTNAGDWLEWAIAVAIVEADDADVLTQPRIDRTIAATMLDFADGAIAARLEAFLTFSSAKARRDALSRARQRVAEHQIIASVARRALQLAA